VTQEEDGGSAVGPTVPRRLLGARLRRLRETRKLSREEAGYEIRASESKISRLELGRVSFKTRDVADLLTLYGVEDESERARLLELARDASTPGWWHPYTDVLPSWFLNYLDLEATAALIRSYEAQLVPGLLQTRDYARAVVQLGYGDADPEETERRVNVRMTRQQLLTRPNPPQLWVVVDEAALRRPIGGTKVLYAQIEALIEAMVLPNVRLQVVPFKAGGHAAVGGAFSILRFPDADLLDVVYIEQLTGALYLDKREDVDHYTVAMDHLCIEAPPPMQTAKLLTDVLAEL
jgi:transcriptional regulator with XRE-family HTH domain